MIPWAALSRISQSLSLSVLLLLILYPNGYKIPGWAANQGCGGLLRAFLPEAFICVDFPGSM